MFHPLFTKLTGAKIKEMEVTALGATSPYPQQCWAAAAAAGGCSRGREPGLGEPLPPPFYGPLATLPTPLFPGQLTACGDLSRLTQSKVLAAPGVSQACHIHLPPSAHPPAFWGAHKSPAALRHAEVRRSWALLNTPWVHETAALNCHSQVVL